MRKPDDAKRPMVDGSVQIPMPHPRSALARGEPSPGFADHGLPVQDDTPVGTVIGVLRPMTDEGRLVHYRLAEGAPADMFALVGNELRLAALLTGRCGRYDVPIEMLGADGRRDTEIFVIHVTGSGGNDLPPAHGAPGFEVAVVPVADHGPEVADFAARQALVTVIDADEDWKEPEGQTTAGAIVWDYETPPAPRSAFPPAVTVEDEGPGRPGAVTVLLQETPAPFAHAESVAMEAKDKGSGSIEEALFTALSAKVWQSGPSGPLLLHAGADILDSAWPPDALAFTADASAPHSRSWAGEPDAFIYHLGKCDGGPPNNPGSSWMDAAALSLAASASAGEAAPSPENVSASTDAAS